MNKKIILIVFVCLLVIGLWFYFGQEGTNYTVGFLLDNKHIEFIFDDWNKYIWPQKYQISCTSSTFLEGYSCDNLLGWDDSQGWRAENTCRDEWVEFTFIHETYVEEITIEKYPFFELLENTIEPKDLLVTTTRSEDGKILQSSYNLTLGKGKSYDWVFIENKVKTLRMSFLNSHPSAALNCSVYLVNFWGSPE